jgi:uncharacterized Rmd1/YagE family protein
MPPDSTDPRQKMLACPPTPRNSPTGAKTTKPTREADRIAEMIVFDYGVVVFFGFDESQERSLMDDLENAMICRKRDGERKSAILS